MFDSNKIQMCRCLTGFRGASCEIGEHAQSVCHNPLTLKKLKYFSINHGDQRIFTILNYYN